MTLGEGIQVAAYSGRNTENKQQQKLGRVHFCPPEALYSLNTQTVHDYSSQNLTPNRIVLAAAGIEHNRLVDLTEKYFADLPTLANNSDTAATHHPCVDSVYTGGEYRLALPATLPHDNLTRIALAFEVPKGWSSPNLVPACVLHTLLGGGNSFSAGGPGKGMYSHLYREILNRFYWAESAEAFTSFHAKSLTQIIITIRT